MSCLKSLPKKLYGLLLLKFYYNVLHIFTVSSCLLLSFSGDESGDTSSGRSPGTKDLALPPPPRRVPPHHFSPPQVGDDCSSLHLILSFFCFSPL